MRFALPLSGAFLLGGCASLIGLGDFTDGPLGGSGGMGGMGGMPPSYQCTPVGAVFDVYTPTELGLEPFNEQGNLVVVPAGSGAHVIVMTEGMTQQLLARTVHDDGTLGTIVPYPDAPVQNNGGDIRHAYEGPDYVAVLTTQGNFTVGEIRFPMSGNDIGNAVVGTAFPYQVSPGCPQSPRELWAHYVGGKAHYVGWCTDGPEQNSWLFGGTDGLYEFEVACMSNDGHCEPTAYGYDVAAGRHVVFVGEGGPSAVNGLRVGADAAGLSNFIPFQIDPVDPAAVILDSIPRSDVVGPGFFLGAATMNLTGGLVPAKVWAGSLGMDQVEAFAAAPTDYLQNYTVWNSEAQIALPKTTTSYGTYYTASFTGIAAAVENTVQVDWFSGDGTHRFGPLVLATYDGTIEKVVEVGIGAGDSLTSTAFWAYTDANGDGWVKGQVVSCVTL